MTHKLILAATAAVALVASAGPGGAFPAARTYAAQYSSVQRVTFWGQAFPYGYNWSLVRACTRYVPVETSRGPVMRRAWVCGERGRNVVSYKG